MVGTGKQYFVRFEMSEFVWLDFVVPTIDVPQWNIYWVNIMCVNSLGSDDVYMLYQPVRWYLCCALPHWQDRSIGGPRPSVPVDDFYELIYLMNNNALDGYGMDISRSGIKKFNSKNMGTFQCNPFSIKAVIPFILLVCQIHCQSVVAYERREKPVATSFRDKVSHTTQRDVYMLFISDS